MDASSLALLGRIAGLGGVATGGFALLVRPILARVGALPPVLRAPLVRLIAGGACGLGALGIVAWIVMSASPDVTVKSEPCRIAAGAGASGNAIICGVAAKP